MAYGFEEDSLGGVRLKLTNRLAEIMQPANSEDSVNDLLEKYEQNDQRRAAFIGISFLITIVCAPLADSAFREYLNQHQNSINDYIIKGLALIIGGGLVLFEQRKNYLMNELAKYEVETEKNKRLDVNYADDEEAQDDEVDKQIINSEREN